MADKLPSTLLVWYPHALALIFVVFFAVLGVAPASRDVWVAEVIPVVIVFALLAVTFKEFRFSNLAYSLMAVWLFWHTVGGHYTFAHVPFGWVTDLFGFERNHFDRVGHFSVGFYAYPLAELVTRKRWSGPVLASFLGICFVMSIAAGYEIVEWWFADVVGGGAGIEFLGVQGDVWDAQKDMLADTLGALAVIMLFWLIRPDRHQKFRERL
jgi:putative membrane protein